MARDGGGAGDRRGNRHLIDRIISPNGVVDFIDVGVGDMRWPTFNVADMAVSVGAILLATVLWREDEQTARVTDERETAARTVSGSSRVRT